MKAVVSMVALLCGLLMAPALASADLVMNYQVNILQTSVNVGDTINWELFANISGTPNVGTNNGIATASVNLVESQSNTMTPGTIGPAFSNYDLQQGGTPNGTGLGSVGVTEFSQNAGVTGTSTPASLLLASGSYVATTAGVHTLQSQFAAATRYFSAPGQAFGSSVAYDQVFFGSDSVTVNAVPEPSSLVLVSLAAIGGWRVRRRQFARTSTI
jgi:hypothetical protein